MYRKSKVWMNKKYVAQNFFKFTTCCTPYSPPDQKPVPAAVCICSRHRKFVCTSTCMCAVFATPRSFAAKAACSQWKCSERALRLFDKLTVTKSRCTGFRRSVQPTNQQLWLFSWSRLIEVINLVARSNLLTWFVHTLSDRGFRRVFYRRGVNFVKGS